MGMVLDPRRVVIFRFFSRLTLKVKSSSFWRLEFCRSQNGTHRMASRTLDATLWTCGEESVGTKEYAVPGGGRGGGGA